MKDTLYDDIMSVYRGVCVMCEEKAVTLHEEPPKSLNPNWMLEPECRFALCNSCHDYVHTISRAEAQFLLDNYRTNKQKKALLFLREKIASPESRSM